MQNPQKTVWSLRDIIGTQIGPFSDAEVDFSGGIFYPSEEVYADSQLPHAIAHNRKLRNAHHDIIIPTKSGNVPVSAKAVLAEPESISVAKQLQSKPGGSKVRLLLWLYLGKLHGVFGKHESYMFLNGTGVCHGQVLDTLIYWKKLRAEQNSSKK